MGLCWQKFHWYWAIFDGAISVNECGGRNHQKLEPSIGWIEDHTWRDSNGSAIIVCAPRSFGESHVIYWGFGMKRDQLIWWWSDKHYAWRWTVVTNWRTTHIVNANGNKDYRRWCIITIKGWVETKVATYSFYLDEWATHCYQSASVIYFCSTPNHAYCTKLSYGVVHSSTNSSIQRGPYFI